MALAFEDAHVIFEDEEAVAFLTGELLQNSKLDEVVDQRRGGVGLGFDEVGHNFDVGHWRSVEGQHQCLRVGLATYVKGGHVFALDALLERQNVLEHLNG